MLDRLITVLTNKGVITEEDASWIREEQASGLELTIKAKKGTSLNYDRWPYLPSDELLSAWLKSKKKAKGSLSQMAINTVGKNFHIAVNNGWTVEDCLEKAENSNWKGFDADWMGVKKNETTTQSAYDRLTDRSWCEALVGPN